MILTQKEIKAMIKVALKTRKFAFAHRSNHQIGASVLTVEGKIFGGCNIESVISGLGTCAERNAMDHAIAHGYYNFRAVCTADSGVTPSCGACLQYTMLFSQLSHDEIFMVNVGTKGDYEVVPLSVLLPHGYKTANNLRRIQSYAKKKKTKNKK